MHSKKPTIYLGAACAVLFGFLATAASAFAVSTEQVLYNFCAQNGCGENPHSGLVFDASGNLYGTAGAGANGSGVVFELTPNGDGTWSQTVLYSFCALSGCVDGSGPDFSNLVLDAAGNVYGTTEGGGAYGYGTIFELVPGAGGTWTEKVVHSFGKGKDGRYPHTGLAIDGAGDLYGTTVYGGPSRDAGIVFELIPHSGGNWTEKILHHFCAVLGCHDGRWPLAGVTLDSKGHVYGATLSGGPHSGGCRHGCGVVFQLSGSQKGKWTEIVLYAFQGRKLKNGSAPDVDLTLDTAGNVYGATSDRIFELVKKNGWAEKMLYKGYGSSALVIDTAGSLYGATGHSGKHHQGYVFELMHGQGGSWTKKVLYSFNDSNGQDGDYPASGVIFDTGGNLYGTTSGGGTSGNNCGGDGCGTVFEITP